MDAITRPAEGTPPGDAHTYRMPLPRLSLAPDVSHGPPDGAWWPRCDALELELPALIGSLDPGVGTVTHVTVATAAWPGAPQEVMAPGHVIEVALTDLAAGAHAITLDCGTGGRWELLVIPPDEPAEAATRLLTVAAAPGNALSAPRGPVYVESGLDVQDTGAGEDGQGTEESEGGPGLR
ncbi:DUF5994 family protein [Streptomyces griseoruber]|uniref:Uncharacterized protein n=1 Tax=Streptomyces griseoruber TaxID=1943 RepID=A0A117R9J4_9ACTN|nr:DUF5994 family protein [Streptomyces griseoruber]KUN78554.1 hypothetical protein AQJ64_31845 [Streptomyces griseoruber]